MKTFILFSIIAMVAMVSAAPTVNDGGLKIALEIAVKQGVNMNVFSARYNYITRFQFVLSR